MCVFLSNRETAGELVHKRLVDLSLLINIYPEEYLETKTKKKRTSVLLEKDLLNRYILLSHF